MPAKVSLLLNGKNVHHKFGWSFLSLVPPRLGKPPRSVVAASSFVAAPSLVAAFHVLRIITSIRLGIVGQTRWAVHDVVNTTDTAVKNTAVVGISVLSIFLSFAGKRWKSKIQLMMVYFFIPHFLLHHIRILVYLLIHSATYFVKLGLDHLIFDTALCRQRLGPS